MDEATLKRLQKLLGEEDVWDEPAPVVNAPANNKEQFVGISPLNFESDMEEGTYDYNFGRSQNQQPQSSRRGKKTGKGAGASLAPPAAARPQVPLADLEKVQLAVFAGKIGDVSPKGMQFTPVTLAVNYPIQYIGNANRAKAAPFFNREALMDKMTWDLFYIWHPTEPNRGAAIILVSTDQFEHFLDLVNAALDHTTAFCIPEGNAGDKFRITFGELGGPRPRFLGKAKGEDAAHELRVAGPGLNESDSEMKGMTAQGRLQFEEKLEQIWKWTAQSAKPKKGSNKAVLNRVKRVTVHRAWGHSVKRVQRYLGIRPRASAALSGSLASLDLSLAMTRPVESVVFIAIDVEWFEFNHNIITEVGLAVLDTWQTVGIAPLANLKNWFRMIKSHHLRVAENAHAVNRVHVRGCENFFDFGSSQFVKEKDMAAAIRSILEPKTAEGLTIAEYTEDRKVVLVGHDLESDIAAIKALGYDIRGDNKQLLEIVDTKDVYRHYRRMRDPASLEGILTDLAIPHRNLHNAGNDAVYTLQALLGIAVKKRLDSLAPEEKKLKNIAPQLPNAGEEGDEGWSSGGEMSDGGLPTANGQSTGDWAG